ncbi:homeobox-leucine zipper protein HOX11-like isoform X2 [Mangifera indica]|uniref:homeobox-leucine zipper protein HOX11-like isoform X2 n=1 Tax=Mangifera indica TaxID=29780 RepID=UPI001CFBED89|nr:homeobox-leucine zipper protein HOX11-like isoform X2 [Mangifera indica]
MELALSLGDASKPFPSFLDKSGATISRKDLGFCMGLKIKGDDEDEDHDPDLPVQLDLLPFSPVPRNHPPPPSKLRLPWLRENDGMGSGLDVNRFPMAVSVEEKEAEEGTTALSSPNSTVSSFQMDFCIGNSRSNKRDMKMVETHHQNERASSRVSDDDENGLTRKKLRLSKEQSAFLEESFKEHNTLNPKQKLTLARQLNLRPRQVEVWFQNRRARTKLKQTEVDCEYLKRCCEALTEENKRLQKELQELRALKSSQPFYMQLPATTLTMCPSCERVVSATTATTVTATAAVAASTNGKDNSVALQLGNNPARLNPFSQAQQSAT